MTPAPPRTAERLLGLVIRRGEVRDGVLGDLAEEFAAAARRQGPAAERGVGTGGRRSSCASISVSPLHRREPFGTPFPRSLNPTRGGP